MQVLFMWPNREYGAGAADRAKQDAFWLKCSPKEAEQHVLPQLSAAQRTQADELHAQVVSKSFTSLISRDLTSIQPLPESYPTSQMWNAYSPFIEIPPQTIHKLSEI